MTDCSICGHSFKPRNKTHKYCSPRCRQVATNDRVRKYMRTDKGRALKKKSNEKWADRKRVSELKTRYGVTPEQYEEILKYSQEMCFICKTTDDLCLDHCHATGVVRGFLCRRHNAALGGFEDNVESLELAIEYLKTQPLRNPDGYGTRDESQRNLFTFEGRMRDR